jgi:uncharacterized protein YndB with AHSA1/START domain
MTDIPFDPERDLLVTRDVDVPAPLLWRCWTEPELLKRWFAPAPWTTPVADIDPRPGGRFNIVMQGPDGGASSVKGCVLVAETPYRLITTELLTEGWRPADTEKERPFALTTVITFEPLERGMTRYTARALHGNVADRQAHEKMGFHTGWGICADQLIALARTLPRAE